jgi:hypothetical protein
MAPTVNIPLLYSLGNRTHRSGPPSVERDMSIRRVNVESDDDDEEEDQDWAFGGFKETPRPSQTSNQRARRDLTPPRRAGKEKELETGNNTNEEEYYQQPSKDRPGFFRRVFRSSKSISTVPSMDHLRMVAEQEHPESEPRADAIRSAAGTAAIVRRLEQEEARRLHEERYRDQELIDENEGIELDGRGIHVTRQSRGHQLVPFEMSHLPGDTESDEKRPIGSIEPKKSRSRFLPGFMQGGKNEKNRDEKKRRKELGSNTSKRYDPNGPDAEN